MKLNLKSKILILIILGITLIFSPIAIIKLRFTTRDRNMIYIDEVEKNNLEISITSETININSNSDWLNFRNAGKCTGAGTYSDPYVIEDLIIDAENADNCIYVGNSNVHFIIKNCTLTNAGPNWEYGGIKLYNCINGILFNNTIKFCQSTPSSGIYLLSSSEITVSENMISNNDYGIYLCYSHSILISENDFINNTAGMWIYSSHGNRIAINDIINSYWGGVFIYRSSENDIVENNVLINDDGILLLESNDNNISRNTIINDRGNGIELKRSNNNLISANTIKNSNENGVELTDSSSNNTIKKNRIYHVGKFGILLKETGTFNTLLGNIMDKCGLGLDGTLNQISTHSIDTSNLVNAKPLYYYSNMSGLDLTDFLYAGQIILVNCRYSIISYLGIYNCSRGIALYFSRKITIIYNSVALNSEEGLYIVNSSENTIIKNNFYRNNIGVKFFDNCHYNIIKDNKISENKYLGIHLYFYCTHNFIFNNDVVKNNIWGVHLVFSNLNVINANLVQNNRRMGFVLEFSDLNNIANNIVEETKGKGFYLVYSDSNLIYKNLVRNNSNEGIELEFSDMNNVANNIVENTNGTGIYLVHSDSNQIYQNIVHHNIIGIDLYFSNTNKIIQNILFSNNHCINEFIYCENNTISGNSCSAINQSIGFEFGAFFVTVLFCIILEISIIKRKKINV